MFAIVLPAYGPPSALTGRDIAEPMLGPDEVKVRVVAAGINPVDWKLRSGAYRQYMPLGLPTVLGRDVAGEIVGIGDAVSSLMVGDRVLGLVRHAYAEYVVAD